MLKFEKIDDDTTLIIDSRYPLDIGSFQIIEDDVYLSIYYDSVGLTVNNLEDILIKMRELKVENDKQHYFEMQKDLLNDPVE